MYRFNIDRDASIMRFENWGFTRTAWLHGCELAKEMVPEENDSRDPAYPFYLSGVHKIKGLNLFHDRTEELDFSTTSRKSTSPFYLLSTCGEHVIHHQQSCNYLEF